MSEHSWDEVRKYPEIVKGEWPTIPEMYEISLKKFPNNNCFSVIEKTKLCNTYKEEYIEIMKVAGLLVSLGLKKGDRVMINGKNSREWATAYLGILFAGCTVCPIDNQMKINRVAELGKFADCKFLFADFDVLEKLSNLDTPWFKSLLGVALLKGNDTKYQYKVFQLDNKPLEKKVDVSEYDTAAILFTSGTTGNEKGVILSHRNITSDIYQAADGMGVNDKDILYALLPLHHSYCCTAVLLETIRHGAECLFGHGIVVSRMINDLKNGHVTVFMGIPLLYNKVLSGIENQLKKKGKFTETLISTLMNFNLWCKTHLKKAPMNNFFKKKILAQIGLDSTKLLICGAGPLAPEVFRKYQALGLNFLQGYGLTETSPILTLNPPEHFKIDSVGKVFPFVDMIIAEPNEDGIGEVRVKGTNICSGYLNAPEHTAELFDENGYLRTGDLGYLDSENYLYLKGRSKNLIVTEGGKNVYPEELEDLFQLYQEVDQILIRGFQEKPNVPSEAIEAVIHPSADFVKANPDKNAIQEHMENIVREINKGLAQYKKIEKVTIVDEPMEMTTTKKIKRATVKK